MQSSIVWIDRRSDSAQEAQKRPWTLRNLTRKKTQMVKKKSGISWELSQNGHISGRWKMNYYSHNLPMLHDVVVIVVVVIEVYIYRKMTCQILILESKRLRKHWWNSTLKRRGGGVEFGPWRWLRKQVWVFHPLKYDILTIELLEQRSQSGQKSEKGAMS